MRAVFVVLGLLLVLPVHAQGKKEIVQGKALVFPSMADAMGKTSCRVFEAACSFNSQELCRKRVCGNVVKYSRVNELLKHHKVVGMRFADIFDAEERLGKVLRQYQELQTMPIVFSSDEKTDVDVSTTSIVVHMDAYGYVTRAYLRQVN